VKRIVAQTLGSREPGEASDDYYFGASGAGGLALPPSISRQSHAKRFDLRFLLADDNYFVAMQSMWADRRTSFGSRRDFTLARLPQLYGLALENAQRPVSQYDVVAINIPWMGEFASKGYIRPATSGRWAKWSAPPASNPPNSRRISGRQGNGAASNTASQSIARSRLTPCGEICFRNPASPVRRRSSRFSRSATPCMRRLMAATASPGMPPVACPSLPAFCFFSAPLP
jgi:hypothetical protein